MQIDWRDYIEFSTGLYPFGVTTDTNFSDFRGSLKEILKKVSPELFED